MNPGWFTLATLALLAWSAWNGWRAAEGAVAAKTLAGERRRLIAEARTNATLARRHAENVVAFERFLYDEADLPGVDAEASARQAAEALVAFRAAEAQERRVARLAAEVDDG